MIASRSASAGEGLSGIGPGRAPDIPRRVPTMPTSSVPCRRLPLRDRWRPRRIVVAALFVVLPALAVPVLGQELPPPETAKEKPKKPPAKGGGASTGTQSGPAAPAATTLLLSSDMACTVSIDGEVVATLSP